MIGMSSARRQLILLAMLVFPASAEAAPYGTLPFTRLPDGHRVREPDGRAGGDPALDRGWRRAARGDRGRAPRRGRRGARQAARLPARRLGSERRGGRGRGDRARAAGGACASRARGASPRRCGWPRLGTVIELDVAVSARGDAVVAWAERNSSSSRVRIRVARRAAGGAFGVPEDIVPWREYAAFGDVQVGMAADGETLVVSREPTGRRTLVMARFGRPRHAARRAAAPRVRRVRSAWDADGRALVVKANGGGVSVLERPPGSAGFTAPQVFSDTGGPIDPAVAFGADGRAVVAWHEPYAGTVGAVVREPGATGFGAPIVVVPAPRSDSGFGFSLSDDGGPPERPSFQAAIGSDGRVRLAWPRKGGGAATAALAGGGGRRAPGARGPPARCRRAVAAGARRRTRRAGLDEP